MAQNTTQQYLLILIHVDVASRLLILYVRSMCEKAELMLP